VVASRIEIFKLYWTESGKYKRSLGATLNYARNINASEQLNLQVFNPEQNTVLAL
jgi:hypothetical protein